MKLGKCLLDCCYLADDVAMGIREDKQKHVLLQPIYLHESVYYILAHISFHPALPFSPKDIADLHSFNLNSKQ